MSSVINGDGEAFFLGISPQILPKDYEPVALLDYKGGLECLLVPCDLLKDSRPGGPPPP